MEKIIRGMSKCSVRLPVIIVLSAVFLTSGCNHANRENEVAKEEVVSYNYDLKEMFENMPKPQPIPYQVPIKESEKVEHEIEDVKPDEKKFNDVLMTHYASNCKGCSGFTYSSYDVRRTTKYNGMNILAVDPKLIQEGSIIEIEVDGETIKAIALDRGGKIKGKHIDLLVKSESYANELGKKYVNLKVVRDGWQDEEKKTRPML